MSRSAAPLGSLRSPRRAAERKSGHFTCSENRTFYLLQTLCVNGWFWLSLTITPAHGNLGPHTPSWRSYDEEDYVFRTGTPTRRLY